ncbi:MAG: gamma carbonic anhydrase family protein [Alphaproteobacteria bacterium]|nr:gamma carbonic anhydrase family protein [Alphaproteobacteria bacterium]
MRATKDSKSASPSPVAPKARERAPARSPRDAGEGRGGGSSTHQTGIVLPYKGVAPALAPDVFIAPTAAVIGDTHIGAGSSVWFAATVRGDVNEIRIGARTNIQDGTTVHVTTGGHGTYIGNDVTVGHNAIIHACTIEDLCLIGMGACLMDGVVVEKNAMVAAGALVTPNKRIPSGQLWAGAPARFMRVLLPEELAEIAESAQHYADLAQAYRG